MTSSRPQTVRVTERVVAVAGTELLVSHEDVAVWNINLRTKYPEVFIQENFLILEESERSLYTNNQWRGMPTIIEFLLPDGEDPVDWWLFCQDRSGYALHVCFYRWP